MEKLTAFLRVVVLLFAALALLPIVVHLWAHAIYWLTRDMDLHIYYWDLFRIGNDVAGG